MAIETMATRGLTRRVCCLAHVCDKGQRPSHAGGGVGFAAKCRCVTCVLPCLGMCTGMYCSPSAPQMVAMERGKWYIGGKLWGFELPKRCGGGGNGAGG